MLIDYIYLVVFISLICFFIYNAPKFLMDKKTVGIIKDFASYMAVLEYFMGKAYDIIHKDRILIYSLEATSIPDEEYNKVSKDYVKLLEKMIGPRLLEQYIFFYGNYETFLFNVLEFFNTKYDSDEIRKSATDELQEADIDEKSIGV